MSQKKEDLGVNGHKDEGRSIDVDKNRTFWWKNNVLSETGWNKGYTWTRKAEPRAAAPDIAKSENARDRSGMKRRNEKVEHDFAYTIIDQG